MVHNRQIRLDPQAVLRRLDRLQNLTVLLIGLFRTALYPQGFQRKEIEPVMIGVEQLLSSVFFAKSTRA